jgi:iron complex outermembrane receptor protein
MLALLSAVWFALAAPVAAQPDVGLSGTVRDAQGLAIPGVTVTLTGPAGDKVAVTDAQGSYRVGPLPVGTYQVRFELPGFRTVTRTGVDVSATGAATLDVTMEIALVESVTVTAQKREENLQRVPIAITALTEQALERSGVVDISRLQFIAPGVNVGRAGEDIRPAIRGARTEQVGAVNDPAVGFHVDGVYKGRPSMAVSSFVDVERVEVMRGPQGTLFGRNTFGGNVHVISKLPTRYFDAGAEVTLGDYSRRKIEGFVNVPVNDVVQLRVAGSVDRRDGYIENTGPAPDLWDEDLNYIRATARIAPSAAFEILLRGTHWDQGGNGQGDFGFVSLGTARDPSTGLITLDGVRDPVSPRRGTLGSSLDSPYKVNRDIPFTRDVAEDVGSLEVNWRTSHAALKSLTNYGKFKSFRQNDGDYSSNIHAVEFTEEFVDSFSQEFQVASAGQRRFNWLAGAFYLQDNLDYRFLFNRMFLDVDTDGNPETASATTTIPNPAGLFSNLEIQKTTSKAIFGQVSAQLVDRLTATVGLRWTEDAKNYSSFNDVTQQFIRRNVERSWTHTTWRAALDYQLSPVNLLYGSVSTGFIAGGFSFGAPNLVYNPQQVTAYELGSKNEFGARTQLNVSAYYNDFRDLLANQFTTDPQTGAVITFQTNAGAIRSIGIEVELQTVPVDNLRLGATIALQDAKYGRFVLQNPFSPPARGTNNYKLVGTTPAGAQFIDLDGNQVALSPTARLTVSAGYDIKTGAGTLTPMIQSYLSSSYTAWDIRIGRDGINVQDAYSRTDLRLSWALPQAQWRVQAYVENLENKAILLRALRGGDNFIQAVYAAPRTAGVRLSYHFK